MDQGKAQANMARIVGQAIRAGDLSATAAEKAAKASQEWQNARATYDSAKAALVVVRAYAWAARLQAGGPIHAEG